MSSLFPVYASILPCPPGVPSLLLSTTWLHHGRNEDLLFLSLHLVTFRMPPTKDNINYKYSKGKLPSSNLILWGWWEFGKLAAEHSEISWKRHKLQSCWQCLIVFQMLFLWEIKRCIFQGINIKSWDLKKDFISITKWKWSFKN